MSPKDAVFPAEIVNSEIISNSNTSTVVALKGRFNGYYAQFWLLFVFRHTKTAPDSCEFTLSLLKVKEKLKTWTSTHYCCHYVSKEGQNKLTSKKTHLTQPSVFQRGFPEMSGATKEHYEMSI